MQILVVSPVNYFPENADGTRKTLFNIFKGLDNTNIDIVCYKEFTNETLSIADGAKKRLPNVNNVIEVDKKNKVDYSKCLVAPLAICKHDLENIEEEMRKCLNNHKYDVIIIVTPFFAPLIKQMTALEKAKTILLAIDSMRLFWERRIQNGNILYKIVAKWQKQMWKNIEEKYYSSYAKVIFVSEVDAEFSGSANSRDNFIAIANGVNIEEFRPDSTVKILEKSIVFSGNMSYGPSFSAAKYLIENIATQLYKVDPTISICIVGSGSEKIKVIADKYPHLTIRCLGYVENLNNILVQSSIYVSPLFLGSGIKTKILEALSAGLPIVGSIISFDGIREIEHCENAFIAHSDDEFISYIIKLFNDEALRRKISRNARNLITKNYSWGQVSKRHFDVLQMLK